MEHYEEIEDARQGIEILYRRGERYGLIEVINIPMVAVDSDEYQ